MNIINKFVISLLMSLMATQVSAGLFSSSCDNASKRAKPDWVNKLDYSLPGMHIGVGSADKNDKTVEEQLRVSEENAKAHLVQQIEVTIRSESEQGTQVKNKDVQDFASNKVLVTAEEVLRGLKVKDRWIDPETCSTFTLMVISREAVALAKREKLMKGYLEKVKMLLVEGASREKNKEAKLRRKYLDDAEIVFKGIDFKLINDEFGEAGYAKKINDAIVEVDQEIARTQGRIAVFALNKDGKVPHEVIGKMLDQMRASDSRSDRLVVDCTDEDECISKAKERGFDQLALLKVATRIEVSNMGALKGTLSVSKTNYDIISKNVINGPFMSSAQVISWGNEELSWETAAVKAMQDLK